MSLPKYQEVLDFWFKESSSKDHWTKNDKYDQKIRDRFLEDVEKAIKNEYDDWQDEAKSSLALSSYFLINSQETYFETILNLILKIRRQDF